ncbi:MAG: ABC transporter permease [Actinobacteria bacterium]|nr:ABC transporter permease [Actinomycetota bacterium]
MARRRNTETFVVISPTGKVLLTAFFALFLVVLYLPTVLLIVFSFNAGTVAAFPLEGLTTKWYGLALHSESIRQALWASVRVATLSAAIATLIALMASYPLARRHVRGKAVISALMLVPLVVPTVVLGVALLILFQKGVIPIGLGLISVMIGHVVIALPFAVLILLPRIASIDKRLEEAAYDLGASGLQMFRRVMLPLIVPSILSAFLISFVFSIDEVVIASFIAGDQPTYPVYLYSGLKFPEKTQTLIPVATIMIVLSFLLAIAAEVIRRRGDRKLEGR